MSVLIKGMEMPKSCSVCRLFGEYGCPFVGAVGYALTRGERNEDCPLVPVPPHGNLIDQDEYRDEFMNGVYALCSDDSDNYRANAIIDLFDCAPTIIPAEEGET